MSVYHLKNLMGGGPDQLGMALAVSFAAHLVLLAILAFWPGWPVSARQTFVPMYQVQLVGGGPPKAAPAPPAPPKAAPKPTPAPPKAAPQPKPQPKPQPAKEAVALKKDQPKKRIEPKKKTEPAPDVNKLIDAKVSRLKKQVAEDRRLESALSRLESKVAEKGGGAYASGGGSAVPSRLSLAFQIYYTEIWERVRRHWVLPEAVVADPRGLKAVVAMRINKSGGLDKVWLEQGSGNARYDQSCLRAVERAAPFPPLPAGYRQSTHEVGLRFNPADAGA